MTLTIYMNLKDKILLVECMEMINIVQKSYTNVLVSLLQYVIDIYFHKQIYTSAFYHLCFLLSHMMILIVIYVYLLLLSLNQVQDIIHNKNGKTVAMLHWRLF